MSDIVITITVPEELLARARAAGIEISSQAQEFVGLLEAEINRREAGKRLHSIAEQLQGLPEAVKPSPEEIDQAVRAARTEIAAEHKPARKS